MIIVIITDEEDLTSKMSVFNYFYGFILYP